MEQRTESISSFEVVDSNPPSQPRSRTDSPAEKPSSPGSAPEAAAPAAAEAAASTEAADTAAPAEEAQAAAGEDSSSAAAAAAGAAAAPAAPAAAAPASAAEAAAKPAATPTTEPAAQPAAKSTSSPPPATSALTSVLGLFGGGGNGDSSSDAAAPAEEKREGDYDPVKDFEAEVMEATAKVEQVGQKLLHGAVEAKESLLQGFSSWWSTFDGPAKAEGGGAGGAASKGGSSQQRVQDVQQAAAQLGLDAGETVLESFACQLLQTYTATNNFFTPVRQVAFAGSLHITSQRLCFAFDDTGVAPIRLLGKTIKSVAKKAEDKKQGLPERLEVLLEQAGQSLVLAHFAVAGDMELDSALALLEHLAEEQ